jgi:hypothetical protein
MSEAAKVKPPAAPEAAPREARIKVKVLEPVDFGAGRKEPGQTVELPADLLDGLVEKGVVEPVPAKPAKGG